MKDSDRLTYFDLQRIAHRELYKYENKKFTSFITRLDFPGLKKEKYSFIYNALYKGIYDENDAYDFVHMMDSVRDAKGLKPSVNVADTMGNLELRLSSYAMHEAVNVLLDLSQKGVAERSKYADALYDMGRRISKEFAHLNHKILEVNYLTSEKNGYRSYTLLKRFDRSLKRGKCEALKTLRPTTVKAKKDFIDKRRMDFKEVFDDFKRELISRGITSPVRRKEIFESIDKGFYQTDFLAEKNMNFIYNINQNDYCFSAEDLSQHIRKMKEALSNIKKLPTNAGEREIKMSAEAAGQKARYDTLFGTQTLPEFSYYFTSAYTKQKIENFEKESSLNKEENLKSENVLDKKDQNLGK